MFFLEAEMQNRYLEQTCPPQPNIDTELQKVCLGD